VGTVVIFPTVVNRFCLGFFLGSSAGRILGPPPGRLGRLACGISRQRGKGLTRLASVQYKSVHLGRERGWAARSGQSCGVLPGRYRIGRLPVPPSSPAGPRGAPPAFMVLRPPLRNPVGTGTGARRLPASHRGQTISAKASGARRVRRNASLCPSQSRRRTSPAVSGR
jgi:hypothetical protein